MTKAFASLLSVSLLVCCFNGVHLLNAGITSSSEAEDTRQARKKENDLERQLHLARQERVRRESIEKNRQQEIEKQRAADAAVAAAEQQKKETLAKIEQQKIEYLAQFEQQQEERRKRGEYTTAEAKEKEKERAREEAEEAERRFLAKHPAAYD